MRVASLSLAAWETLPDGPGWLWPEAQVLARRFARR